jgi:hypothetical protein
LLLNKAVSRCLASFHGYERRDFVLIESTHSDSRRSADHRFLHVAQLIELFTIKWRPAPLATPVDYDLALVWRFDSFGRHPTTDQLVFIRDSKPQLIMASSIIRTATVEQDHEKRWQLKELEADMLLRVAYSTN